MPDIQVTDAEAVPNTEAPGSGAGELGSDPVGFGGAVGSSRLTLQFEFRKYKTGGFFPLEIRGPILLRVT